MCFSRSLWVAMDSNGILWVLFGFLRVLIGSCLFLWVLMSFYGLL